MKRQILSVGVLSLIIYGLLLVPTIGIDTETMINNTPQQLMAWLGANRVGLVLIKRILWQESYQQFLGNLLAIISLALLSFLLIRIYSSIQPSPFTARQQCLFLVVFIACPITYFQLYFKLQSFEIMLAALLVTSATFTFWYFGNKKLLTKVLLLFFSAAVIGFSISIYQSMLDYTTTLYLSFVIFSESLAEKEAKALWKNLFQLFFLCVFSLIFYSLLNSRFNPLFQLIPNEGYHAIHFMNSKSLLLVALLFLFGFALVIIGKKKCLDCKTLVSWFLLSSAPFATAIVTGFVVSRAFFPSLPLIIALYSVRFLPRKKRLRKIGLIFAFIQLLLTLSFQIIEINRYHKDVALAKDILKRAARLGVQSNDESYRIQFVGKNHQNDWWIKIPGEPVGQSFFGYDPLPGQGRSDGFMRALGFDLIPSSLEENQAALVEYAALPNYPESGAVVTEDQVLIIKFSNE